MATISRSLALQKYRILRVIFGLQIEKTRKGIQNKAGNKKRGTGPKVSNFLVGPQGFEPRTKGL